MSGPKETLKRALVTKHRAPAPKPVERTPCPRCKEQVRVAELRDAATCYACARDERREEERAAARRAKAARDEEKMRWRL